MRVLLVEDDRMIGEAVEAALKDTAYAVDWVRDGQMAIEALASHRYDIVLLDLGLPRKDGLEVLRSIRGRDDAVPVLIVTARDALEDRIAGRGARLTLRVGHLDRRTGAAEHAQAGEQAGQDQQAQGPPGESIHLQSPSEIPWRVS